MSTYQLLSDEYWWGGTVDVGPLAPYGKRFLHRDLADPGMLPDGQPVGSGQSSPFLISTRGRVVRSAQPFSYTFDGGQLHLDDSVTIETVGEDLQQAYRALMQTEFAPSGSHPAWELLTAPQYNTWIEMPYLPDASSVLSYVDSILAADLPAGTLLIDDNWAPAYGDWVFDTRRFPQPAQFLSQLHERGFNVMLWLVPFISPDSANFRELDRAGLLLRQADGAVAVRHWWNGYSAVLDITNPAAREWLSARLDALRELGVDGFKYDAGDVGFYRPDDISYSMASPVEHCQAWAAYGERTPFNEYRACWKMGGRGLGQRLRDKPPQWGPCGIESLIPETLGQAMIGHYYTCPDMIGGGEVGAFEQTTVCDQEFVVRYAQVAALMPMLQFSLNPARILDAQHLQFIKAALELRRSLGEEILQLARGAATTGIPIVRPLAFHCSHPQAASINDQFFFGEDVIVAPQLHAGAKSRAVFLPGGTWQDDNGQTVEVPGDSGAGQWVEVDTPLSRLPYFRRQR